MSGARKRRAFLPAALRAALAFGFLNACLSLSFPADPWTPTTLLRLSPEALFLPAALALSPRLGPRGRRLHLAWLAALVLGLRLFQSADAAIPLFFHRPFSLVLDLPRVPDFFRLLALTRTPAETAGLAAAAAAAGIGLVLFVHRALSALETALRGLSPRLRLGVATAALGGGLAAALLAPADARAIAPASAPRLAGEVARWLRMDALRASWNERFAEAATRAAALRPDFAGLGGESVFVVFVESYGANALFDPRLAGETIPALRRLERDLAGAGFRLASALRRAPTAGGGSWLAHATLASGVRIDGQLAHDLLPASPLVPLAARFREAGYRTLRAAPGTRWPAAGEAFYRFEETRIAPDFGYRGPGFGFSPVPDQFVLEWVGRHTAGGGPFFAEVILTGSHTPFDRRAGYLADWDALGDGSVYEGAAGGGQGFFFEARGEHEAYRTLLLDSLAAVAGFARRHLRGNELLIFLGDHAPPIEIPPAVDAFSVPVHLVTRRESTLAEFQRRGFRPGIVPEPSAEPPGLETLFWDLIGGFNASRSPERETAGDRRATAAPPPG
ncbi:MAG: hypothetical protein WHT06_13015 [Desulfobacterales bacterium]